MKIGNLSVHNLRNDAHFQFFTEFRDLVEAKDDVGAKNNVGANNYSPLRAKITPLFDEFLTLYEREDEALKKIVKSEYTAKIHEADKARDDIYIGMLEMNKAGLKHFSEETRTAAGRLKIVFDTYGDVAKKPLNQNDEDEA
jgi:DNA polymerase II small subunit/DNA polymerase delta subunit B